MTSRRSAASTTSASSAGAWWTMPTGAVGRSITGPICWARSPFTASRAEASARSRRRPSPRAAVLGDSDRSLQLIGILAAKALEDRLQHDLDVPQQRPVPDVMQVVFDAFLHFLQGIGFTPPAVDLRPAGDTWLDLVAQHVALDLFPVELVVGHRMGSRPHDRHAALQHIEELGQFIQRGPSQESPNR